MDKLNATIRFSVFEVDAERREIRKHGVRINLQERPFLLLLALLKHPGDLVTREQLRTQLWPSEVFVDFESGLNVAVQKLRQTLNDDPVAPRYIETLRGKGYRFIAPLLRSETEFPVQSSETPAPTPGADTAEAPVAVFAIPWRQRFLRPIWGLLALAVLAVVWVAFRRPSSVLSNYNVLPLGTFLGEEYAPTFSPDGRQVAFTWNGKDGKNFDIYLMLVGSQEALRLTSSPEMDTSPAWSPDGRWIAFCRNFPDVGGAVFIIPALGGAERKVAALSDNRTPSRTAISWSADSKWLVVDSPPSEHGLRLVNAFTQETRGLTQPSDGAEDVDPAFSPDGRSIAFIRDVGRGISSVHILPLTAEFFPQSPPRQLSWTGFGNGYSGRPAWTPDSKQLVFASDRDAHHRLWIAPVDGSRAPEPLTSLGEDIVSAAISPVGQLAFVSSRVDKNIWRLKLTKPVSAPSLAIGSTRLEESPRISPDGTKVVFASDRSGYMEIWVSELDGSNPEALTTLKSLSGSPSWSPDGAQIAFDSSVDGSPSIYTVPAAGGATHRVNGANSRGVVPNWSVDGKWIYFSSRRSGAPQIWRVPAAGGEERQVTKNGGFAAMPSPDGQFIYYNRNNSSVSSLWQMNLSDSQETLIAPAAVNRGFAPGPTGIYFLSANATALGEQQTMLEYFDLRSHSTSQIRQMERRVDYGLTVDFQRQVMMYGQVDENTTQLQLVQNFWR